MDRNQEIEDRIGELRGELDHVEGSTTEIYTRIVGNYRSLKNWNKGKREEYDHRVTFRSESEGTPGARTPAPAWANSRQTGSTAAAAFAEAAMEAASMPAPITATRFAAESAPVLHEGSGDIRSYAYFFRNSCPNCPPVRTYVENLSLEGLMVDVDTGEGMARAVEHQILSTPTVILMNADGDTVAQAGNVEQLRTILESAS